MVCCALRRQASYGYGAGLCAVLRKHGILLFCRKPQHWRRCDKRRLPFCERRWRAKRRVAAVPTISGRLAGVSRICAARPLPRRFSPGYAVPGAASPVWLPLAAYYTIVYSIAGWTGLCDGFLLSFLKGRGVSADVNLESHPLIQNARTNRLQRDWKMTLRTQACLRRLPICLTEPRHAFQARGWYYRRHVVVLE